jgi:transposase
MKFKRIAIDTSKHVFTLHGVDEQERPALRREIKRHQVDPFFAKLPATEVVREACGGSHHWGRVLQRLGHRVRLILPQYVKPFVKRAKNYCNDAEAISEAAARPTMRSVPVKTTEQQAGAMVLRHRELLQAQRTQAISALRGHAAEFGVIAAKGMANVAALLSKLASEEAIPTAARAMFTQMGEHIGALEQRLAGLDAQLAAPHKANPFSQRLAAVPGVGLAERAELRLDRGCTAVRLCPPLRRLAGTDAARAFHWRKAAHAPDQQRRQRTAARAAGRRRDVRHPCARPGSKCASAWLLQLLERKPRKLAAVALANKMGRIIWSMMVRGEAYRPQPAAA